MTPRAHLLWTWTLTCATLAACGKGEPRQGAADAQQQVAAAADDSCSVWSDYRGIIGAESPKIMKSEDGRTYVWAGGDEQGPGAQWYDFTNSPIPAEELQYGIGKDRIPSIDDPVWVSPDDPRLLEIPPSPYRRCERPKSNDEIMVIGYVTDGQARAYPTALMDQHEVVNDRSPKTGKPFTVGW